MRIWIVTLMLALGGIQVAPPNNGVIEGRVIRASNGAPVVGARVVLVPPPAPRPPASAVPAPGVPAPNPPADAPQRVVVNQNLNGQIVTSTADVPPGTRIQVQNGQIVTVNAAGVVTGVLNTTPVNEIAVVTDDDGKFSFRNLEPGRYTL